MSVAAAARELARELPPGRVHLDEARRERYARDLTECEGVAPDLVVEAETVRDVQATLAAARAHRLPVVPVAWGTNVGGLALPLRGGIALDLRLMRRIVETNREDAYIVVEPGVTWEDVRAHLARAAPELRFAYSLAPPESSVLANGLMDGLVNLSLRHGTTANQLNGLEVVLASGEVVRTGSRAHGSPTWHARPPLPDLTGIFVNAQGTMGVAVKGSFELHPAPSSRRRLFWLGQDLETAYGFLCQSAHDDLADDLALLSTAVAKMALGVAAPGPGPAGEPRFLVHADVSGSYPSLLAARLQHLCDQARYAELAGPLDADDLVALVPALAKLAEFPTRLDFLLDAPGGGLTWVGTYGPTSRWAEGTERGLEVLRRHGRPELLVTRAMKGAHYGVLRFVALFDRSDPAERARVRRLNEELADAVVDLGFFPYKTPLWAVERYRDRLDPGFLALLGRIRAAVDPDGLLAPGRWPA